jgi:hypothetical protein
MEGPRADAGEGARAPFWSSLLRVAWSIAPRTEARAAKSVGCCHNRCHGLNLLVCFACMCNRSKGLRGCTWLIAVDVVDLQSPGRGVTQDHVAGAMAGEIAEHRLLPIQTDGAHEVGPGDLVVMDVVDLDPAGVDVAQQHVGFAEAPEIAEAHDLP